MNTVGSETGRPQILMVNELQTLRDIVSKNKIEKCLKKTFNLHTHKHIYTLTYAYTPTYAHTHIYIHIHIHSVLF